MTTDIGAASGLELVDALADEPSLRAYHLLLAVRGELLERAAALTRNAREREVLLRRARLLA